jgi:hypothetical protein
MNSPYEQFWLALGGVTFFGTFFGGIAIIVATIYIGFRLLANDRLRSSRLIERHQYDRLRASHTQLLAAAKGALTFMSPTGHAQDMLQAAIAHAEELAP